MALKMVLRTLHWSSKIFLRSPIVNKKFGLVPYVQRFLSLQFSCNFAKKNNFAKYPILCKIGRPNLFIKWYMDLKWIKKPLFAFSRFRLNIHYKLQNYNMPRTGITVRFRAICHFIKKFGRPVLHEIRYFAKIFFFAKLQENCKLKNRWT